MFIDTISPESAEGTVAEIYEEARAAKGYVPNYSRVFALRPEVFDAWDALASAIRKSMGKRRYELATLAAARSLKSSYCSLAHGKVLRDQVLGSDQLIAVMVDPTDSGIPSEEQKIMEFAERVATDASAITSEEVQALRDSGLSDPEILDVALAAAARSFFSKVLDAMGADPDNAYLEMEPELRELLVVGRPIATS